MITASDWTTAHGHALDAFLDTFDTAVAHELAPKLSCREVNVIATLMRVNDRDDLAATWINSHSHADDDGDRHFRTPDAALRFELDVIAGSVADIELFAEDPDAFGAGDLELHRGESETLALTAYFDDPADESPTGWDWEQTHRSPSGGPIHTDATGRCTAAEVDQLVQLAWAWAAH